MHVDMNIIHKTVSIGYDHNMQTTRTCDKLQE